jgi:3-oxoisoapionate kinase
LIPSFTALKALGAPLFHYKICSTFDSSPGIGSIGHAIEIGQAIFNPSLIPLVVGAPALNRYVVFGNLFATVREQTYRLDRHPTMSRHPITPMDESDLRLHLGKQTPRKIGLIDILQLESARDHLYTIYQTLAQQGCDIVLFDTLTHEHLAAVGGFIGAEGREFSSFIVGSSGVEHALAAHWRETGALQDTFAIQPPDSVDQLIVMCGSAAPTTMEQIKWALANGYAGIRLDSACLVDPAQSEGERQQVIQAALEVLGQGSNLVMYSALGSDDHAIAETQRRIDQLNLRNEPISALLGKQQGLILRAILERSGLKRACVAGGDTSGHVAHQLGISALEILGPISPGAPLCRATSAHRHIDGLQIAFKGGQNGGIDYFRAIQQGRV